MDLLTEKLRDIANSVSFDARDFKIALTNIVFISNLRKFCVPH